MVAAFFVSSEVEVKTSTERGMVNVTVVENREKIGRTELENVKEEEGGRRYLTKNKAEVPPKGELENILLFVRQVVTRVEFQHTSPPVAGAFY